MDRRAAWFIFGAVSAFISVAASILAQPSQAHNDTTIIGTCDREALQLLRDIDRRLVLLMSR